MLFACQQSCVLLPLTAMSINPISVNVPADTVKAICYHKYAVAGIPYGVPMIFGGILGLAMANACFQGFDSGSKKPEAACLPFVGLIFAAGGLLLLVTGVGLFGFWLVAGFGIGLWFTFGSVTVLADLALVKILAGPSVFVLDSLAAAVTAGLRLCFAAPSDPLASTGGCMRFMSAKSTGDMVFYLMKNWTTSAADGAAWLLGKKPRSSDAGDRAQAQVAPSESVGTANFVFPNSGPGVGLAA
jgi:hypothetical protein